MILNKAERKKESFSEMPGLDAEWVFNQKYSEK